MKIRNIAAALCIGTLVSFSSHAANLCSVGDNAEVLWKEKWYPVVVTKVNEDQSRCFIHYTGYENSWDEWVGGDRYRSMKSTSFKVGDPVDVKWKGKWYAASILKIGENKYRIHYDQYDNSWDEWVGPDRIRAR